MEKSPIIIKQFVHGLVGYMVYQSNCGISNIYSEYLLYDPILRIAKNKNWNLINEHTIDNKRERTSKRIDFYFSKKDTNIFLEMKRVKAKSPYGPDLKNDINKLLKVKNKEDDSRCFIIVTGCRERRYVKNWNDIEIEKIFKKYQNIDNLYINFSDYKKIDGRFYFAIAYEVF